MSRRRNSGSAQRKNTAFVRPEAGLWGDTINEPDNGLAFGFRGFTVSFAEGKIFVSDEGRAFARYEISHFLQDPGAVVRDIRRECLQRDSMRELSKI